MKFSLSISSLLLFAVSTSAWPNTPLVTSGRWIIDSIGENVTYAGANWPGATLAMVPEGLQYQSIATIVSGLKSLGMNVIRLTYATEMIDDIYDSGDVTLEAAFTTALGLTNGSKIYADVLKNNPSFSASTTRLDVFDAIAAECANQEIYVHLDNHMSKGGWCCSADDGNAWFGDTYFNVANWKRGLEYMVTHGKSWPNLISIGLRNELREPSNTTLAETYDWSTWYTNMVAASEVVNAANSDILIFFSGLAYDTTLTPIVAGTDLGNGVTFKKSNFAYSDKMVLELHNYEDTEGSCWSIESSLQSDGFDTLTGTQTNTFPMVMTEWGDAMTDYTSTYVTCLASYLPAQRVGWTVWPLAGSYYIRQGIQNYDETWGMYNQDWSGWRNANAIAELKTMVAATTA